MKSKTHTNLAAVEQKSYFWTKPSTIPAVPNQNAIMLPGFVSEVVTDMYQNELEYSRKVPNNLDFSFFGH